MREESINAQHHLGIRPFCSCCGGGERRAGYTCTKAKSRKKNRSAKRTSHGFNRRDRAAARPDKY